MRRSIILILGFAIFLMGFYDYYPSTIILNVDAVNSTPAHGEMWNYTTSGFTFPIASNGVYYNLSNLTYGELNGFTFVDADTKDGGSYLIANEDGFYSLDFSMSFAGTLAGSEYGVEITHNWNPVNHRDCYSRRDVTSTAIGSLSATCLMDISAGDTINIIIEDENAPGRDIVIYTANLNVFRLQIPNNYTHVASSDVSNYSSFSNRSDFWDDLDITTDITVLGNISSVDNLTIHNSAVIDPGCIAFEWQYNNLDWSQQLCKQAVTSKGKVLLPSGATTISGNAIADSLSVPDTFTGTAISLYMAQCIEHVGDKNNQMCFSGTDSQKFTLRGNTNYIEAETIGGKERLYLTAYEIISYAGADGFTSWGDADFWGNNRYDEFRTNMTTHLNGTPIILGGYTGSYTGGSAHVCIYDNGTIFMSEASCP